MNAIQYIDIDGDVEVTLIEDFFPTVCQDADDSLLFRPSAGGVELELLAGLPLLR